MIEKPFPQSYWARAGLLCAGHYPGALDIEERNLKLAGLLDCDIRRVINLIPENETGAYGRAFDPYEPILQSLAAGRRKSVECLRLGFTDGTTPERSLMSSILDTLDNSVAAKEAVYVHCWGGHGRTSTVVGCYLVRHGATPQEAINQILEWRRTLPKHHPPYEGKQEDYVRAWRVNE